MRDGQIFYKAVLALVDREVKVKAMTLREIAEALVLALAKVIEAAPDEPTKTHSGPTFTSTLSASAKAIAGCTRRLAC